MYCPNCKQSFPGKFCPECGSKLIDEPAPATPDGFNINLGDANAISGGINLTDSHNVQNTDNSVHNISNVSNVTHNVTQVAAQKTEMELIQERKSLFLNACKRAYEDNILELSEKIELDRYRVEIGLDEATAESILESVRQSVNRTATKSELPQAAKIRLKHLTDALKHNETSAIMRQIDTFESMAGKFTNEELHYKYYLVLAALKPEKCIEKYETSKVDNYWRSYWTYFAYLKKGQVNKASEILFSMEDKYQFFPQDNITLLSTAGTYFLHGAAAAKEELSLLGADYSTSLQRFAESVYYLVEPETAKEMGATEQGCAFYLINIFGKETEKAKENKAEEADITNKAAADAAEQQKAAPQVSELQMKWKKMTFDAIKLVLEQNIQSLDDIYSFLDILIPPAMAEVPLAMAFIALVAGDYDQDYANEWVDKLMALDPQNQDADVMFAKATVFEEGLGRYDKNINNAIAFYKAASMKGNLDALCSVANLYFEGKEVPQDYKLALGWAKMAYESKNAFGLLLYGVAFYEGKGLPKNTLTGKQLIQYAAQLEGTFSMGSIFAKMYIKENFS